MTVPARRNVVHASGLHLVEASWFSTSAVWKPKPLPDAARHHSSALRPQSQASQMLTLTPKRNGQRTDDCQMVLVLGVGVTGQHLLNPGMARRGPGRRAVDIQDPLASLQPWAGCRWLGRDVTFTGSWVYTDMSRHARICVCIYTCTPCVLIHTYILCIQYLCTCIDVCMYTFSYESRGRERERETYVHAYKHAPTPQRKHL